MTEDQPLATFSNLLLDQLIGRAKFSLPSLLARAKPNAWPLDAQLKKMNNSNGTQSPAKRTDHHIRRQSRMYRNVPDQRGASLQNKTHRHQAPLYSKLCRRAVCCACLDLNKKYDRRHTHKGFTLKHLCLPPWFANGIECLCNEWEC